MAKQTSNSRKTRTSSIYRSIEQLLGCYLSLAERTPKKAQGLQTLSARMVNEVLEAMTATEFALNCSNIEQRLAFIGAMLHSLVILKSATRQLYMYSRKSHIATVPSTTNGTEVVEVPRYGRIISNKQYMFLLARFSKLETEAYKWLNATQALANRNNSEM